MNCNYEIVLLKIWEYILEYFIIFKGTWNRNISWKIREYSSMRTWQYEYSTRTFTRTILLDVLVQVKYTSKCLILVKTISIMPHPSLKILLNSNLRWGKQYVEIYYAIDKALTRHEINMLAAWPAQDIKESAWLEWIIVRVPIGNTHIFVFNPLHFFGNSK